MNKYTYHALAICFSLLFFIFRLTDVGSNPKGFYCDEAAIAYNAKSILETGKDEHGFDYPIFFKSYGDYKSALYVYSVAISQKLFGKNEQDNKYFTTRLPAALFLALLLPISYLILANIVHPACGLLSIFLLGSEPWLHHFSHIGFSLSAIPLLLASAIYFWVLAEKHSKKYFILSALFFSLAVYTYAPARLFVPIFTISIITIYFKDMENKKAFLFWFICPAVLASVPLIYYLLFEEEFLKRVEYLNIFTTPYLRSSAAYKQLGLSEENNFTSIIVGLWNYTQIISPQHLFSVSSYNFRFGTPHFGLLSQISAVGFTLGVLSALKNRTKFDLLLLAWLVIFPIPGALTWEDIPHAGRSIVAHPGLNLLASIGLWRTGAYILGDKKLLKVYSCTTFILCAVYFYSFNAFQFQNYYSNEYTKQSSGWMQYGFKEMMEYIKEHKNKYEKVVIVTHGLHYEPEMFILLYSNFPPTKWQEDKKIPWNITVNRQPLDLKNLNRNVLYIFSPSPDQIPKNIRILKNVMWEDNISKAFTILELR